MSVLFCLHSSLDMVKTCRLSDINIKQLPDYSLYSSDANLLVFIMRVKLFAKAKAMKAHGHAQHLKVQYRCQGGHWYAD